ncbi:hypothetical protein GCM10008905_22390 [Clostridium malenominatum]|uniref:Sporulation stage II protein D amidase enhancer LytB N-terminal domain-containing protein n=1 Tax=Clostridium malenominatum TaxID=1539 RepID=A0ABN1J1T5_9CLOT
MKKFILLTLFLITILLSIIFMPRSKEHAVVMMSGEVYSQVYNEDKIYTVKLPEKYSPGTVINYKYNFFKIFKVEVLTPLKERVMKVEDNRYDLELSGELLSHKAVNYYTLNDQNNISLSDDKKILIGKNNLNIYLNKQNEIKTFVVKPYNYSNMRVGLSTTGFNSLDHEEIILTCLEDGTLFNLRENFNEIIPQGTMIKIYTENGKIVLNINNAIKTFSERTYLNCNNIRIDSISRGIPEFTPNYSGVLEFTKSNNGLSLINEVNMEEYLYKVVPSEMPSSGGIESLKCQAIAARTYALSDMIQNRFSHLGFYVDDSTQSQVYNNMKSNLITNEAVYSTKGLIITYEDKPIDAKYYSSSAGVGTTYQTVWFNADGSSEDKNYYYKGTYIKNNSLPKNEKEWLTFYKDKTLKSLDSTSPYFRWHADFSKKALENSLNKSIKIIHDRRPNFIQILQSGKQSNTLPQLVDLTNIEVVKRSEFGNIIEISFQFANATINVKGDYNIRSAIRCNKDFSGEIIPIIRHIKEPLINNNFLPSSFFSIEKNAEGYRIYGGGYGHGVGMSQYGAMELSQKGLKYEEILNTFYKDVTIEKIY